MNKENIGCIVLCVIMFFVFRSCIGRGGASNEDILESINEEEDGISEEAVRSHLRDDDKLVEEHGEKYIIRTCEECGNRYKVSVKYGNTAHVCSDCSYFKLQKQQDDSYERDLHHRARVFRGEE